jgi:hypothetical protein
MISVQRFLSIKKRKEKKGYILLWLMISWVEWDKIFDFIAYVETLDRFTNTTYACCTWRGSERGGEKISGSRVGLTTHLDLVFDAEFEKMFSEAQKNHEVKYKAYFGKHVFFEKIDFFQVFCCCRPENKVHLQSKRIRFSWSVAHTLSNDMEKRKKKFPWSLNCPYFTSFSFLCQSFTILWYLISYGPYVVCMSSEWHTKVDDKRISL